MICPQGGHQCYPLYRKQAIPRLFYEQQATVASLTTCSQPAEYRHELNNHAEHGSQPKKERQQEKKGGKGSKKIR